MEAKNSDLLSSYDGYLFEPIEWPKWSQASFGVLREDSVLISRPGRKGWALSRDDEGSRGFFKLQRDVWGFLKLRRGTQGASCVAPGKSGHHLSCERECSIALESQQGHRVSRRIEGGSSRSFSSCGRKIWVPSTCDGDLRELLRVPMGSQEYCGVGRELLELHWVWCNGRGPHLELGREPQGSSAVLTWVSGCVYCLIQGVRSPRVWRHETLLSSRVVKGVSGLQRVEFGTLGSFWISNQGIRTPFML